MKITQDAGGKPVDPDTRGFEEDPDITARVVGFLERYLPGALGPVRTDQDVPVHADPRIATSSSTRCRSIRNVSVAVGAGHAFKFACVIGRILSDLALEGPASR